MTYENYVKLKWQGSQIKFYWEAVTPICLHTLYGSFALQQSGVVALRTCGLQS